MSLLSKIYLRNQCPERVFFTFLQSLDDENSFWNHNVNFTPEFCFQYCNPNTEPDLNKIKDWFNTLKSHKEVGERYAKLLNIWKNNNPTQVSLFKDDFEKILEKTRKL